MIYFLSRAKGAEHVDHEGCFIVLSETVKHANSHPLSVYNCSVSCSSVRVHGVSCYNSGESVRHVVQSSNASRVRCHIRAQYAEPPPVSTGGELCVHVRSSSQRVTRPFGGGAPVLDSFFHSRQRLPYRVSQAEASEETIRPGNARDQGSQGAPRGTEGGELRSAFTGRSAWMQYAGNNHGANTSCMCMYTVCKVCSATCTDTGPRLRTRCLLD